MDNKDIVEQVKERNPIEDLVGGRWVYSADQR